MSFRSARRTRAALGVAAVGTSLALLSGCSPGPTTDAVPSPSSSTTERPVAVDNCGFALPLSATPRRIITIKSTSTDMLLALGLGKHIIGQASQDGPAPAEWAAEAAAIPVLSEKVPGYEAVLKAKPDFVYAGWESNLTAEGAGDRTDFAGVGVGTYVSPAACTEPGYKPKKLTFDRLFGEIEEAGTVFRAEEAAARIVQDQRAQLASITPSSAGLTALWYSSGGDVPSVGAGSGAPQMMMQALGLRNIAASVDDSWTSYSWESVAAADPSVIVLVDASWNTAASKIERLSSNPATANLDAVVNKRYLVIPFADGEAGVRSVPATADLANQLSALDLR